MEDIQPGSMAEWAGAIGTFLAVVIAFVIALRDNYLRRRSDEQKQAESIAAWPMTFGLMRKDNRVYLSNASPLPIHDVVVSYGVAYGAGKPYTRGDAYQVKLLRLPPGEYLTKAPKGHGGGGHVAVGLAISFRDINGKYWLRDASGRLGRIKKHPFDEMEVAQPISNWSDLDPVKPVYKP